MTFIVTLPQRPRHGTLCYPQASGTNNVFLFGSYRYQNRRIAENEKYMGKPGGSWEELVPIMSSVQ
jgi:hypothetical protein